MVLFVGNISSSYIFFLFTFYIYKNIIIYRSNRKKIYYYKSTYNDF